MDKGKNIYQKEESYSPGDRQERVGQESSPLEETPVRMTRVERAKLQKEKSKSTRFKRFARFTGNLAFVGMLLIMFFLVFSLVQSRLTGEVPSIAGYQMYVVKGGSMSPTFEAGSLAFLTPTETQSIREGDIITYLSGNDKLTTHRVTGVNQEGEHLTFTTRGDANLIDDPSPVLAENVVGEVVYTLPYMGYLMSFGQTQLGMLTLVIIPGLIIIAFELRNIYYYASQMEKEKEEKRKKKEILGTDVSPREKQSY